jgi:hypothetical protein
MPAYDMHGLTVMSDHVLPHDRYALSTSSRPKVRLRQGPAVESLDGLPDGQVLLQFHDSALRYAVTLACTGLRYRHPDLCEYEISPECDDVVVRPLLDGPSELIPLITIGNLMTLLLERTGHYVVHASAVELDGHVVAVIGTSGSGKTTTAALLTEAGQRLVTDDVLRIDTDSSGLVAWPGGTRLRMRPGSLPLLKSVGPGATTPDGRAAVVPEFVDCEPLPLGLIICPTPVPASGDVTVRRLKGAEALRVLIREPRLMDWGTPAYAVHRLTSAAAIARSAPVCEVTVPWGVPAGGLVGERLRTALLAELARQPG